MTNACPKCSRDDQVQKVTAIVTGGTYTTTYQVPAQGQLAGHTIYGTVQQTGTGQTDLAGRLSRPTDNDWKSLEKRWREKPADNALLQEYLRAHPSPGVREKNAKLKTLFITPGFFGILIGLGALCLTLSNMNSSGDNPGLAIGGLILLVSLVLVGIGWLIYQLSNSPEHKREFADWQKALTSFKAGIVPNLKRNSEARYQELYYCHRDDVVFLPGTTVTFSSGDLRSMAAWIQLGQSGR